MSPRSACVIIIPTLPTTHHTSSFVRLRVSFRTGRVIANAPFCGLPSGCYCPILIILRYDTLPREMLAHVLVCSVSQLTIWSRSTLRLLLINAGASATGNDLRCAGFASAGSKNVIGMQECDRTVTRAFGSGNGGRGIRAGLTVETFAASSVL